LQYALLECPDEGLENELDAKPIPGHVIDIQHIAQIGADYFLEASR
jgi:hypothetical protein